MKFRRGDTHFLSKFFTAREFTCHCGQCVEQLVSEELLSRLDNLRDDLGHPIKVTNGYRCHTYQEILRNRGHETAKGISQHELGGAADITTYQPQHLPSLLQNIDNYFSSVGIAKTWCHVDIRPGTRKWTYKP